MEDKQLSRAMAVLGVSLALGMSVAAFILGVQAKRAVTGQHSITVKGLAEKPVKADSAEWTVTISTQGETIAEALHKLRDERPLLVEFLNSHGLDAATRQEGNEAVKPHFDEEYLENGQQRRVQHGFDAVQGIRMATQNLDAITEANRDLLQLLADNHPLTAAPPSYLVSRLEEVKMSLIAAATRNAKARAREFVKDDEIGIGSIRTASQGAFYILPVGGEVGDEDYGGVYDKSTIDKTARVVVTIVYNLNP